MLPWGLPDCHVPAPAAYRPDSTFQVNLTPTYFHTCITNNYRPTTTVHQQQPATPSPHSVLVAYTRQIPSTCFTLQPPFHFFQAYINTTQDGSKNSVVVAIATATFATSMQPYSKKSRLSQDHYTWRVPQNYYFSPHFIMEPLLSVASPFFLHQNPPNSLQKINKISIDSGQSPHRLFSKKIPSFGDIAPSSHPPLPPLTHTHTHTHTQTHTHTHTLEPPTLTTKVHEISTDPDDPL